MKKKEKTTWSKKQKKSPETDPKEMEIYELHDKEFKIIVSKKLSELEENTDKQLNKIQKMKYEQSENTNKEIKTVTNNK